MQKLLTWFICSVWLVNGLFCKVLNMVPRHQEIVAEILDNENARLLTLLIGLAEIVMAVWIASGIHSRLNVIVQVVIIITMNTIEFILVPDLLLWGKFNSVFAFLFILLIIYNEFGLRTKSMQQA